MIDSTNPVSRARSRAFYVIVVRLTFTYYCISLCWPTIGHVRVPNLGWVWHLRMFFIWFQKKYSRCLHWCGNSLITGSSFRLNFTQLASVWVVRVVYYSPQPQEVLMAASRYHLNVSTEAIHYHWTLYSALGSSTSTDIVIASSLCYLLATSRTGFSR